MRAFIVGTAGHIDHGKSALVQALTGTDPDRLPEEKQRGITIDLGFAHMALGADAVSFVDVPGHERFVRNMLAGAHGVDAVLLVVAADESVMPQTREHFHICRLLGVARGLVVLTKSDLADADSLALAELEVRELVQGSFLEGAPLLRVSARTGAGLDALRAALAQLLAGVPERASGGLLRLPIDRAFTLRGFGTVVTGSLVSGEVAVGDELEVLPSGRRVRVRGLQTRGESAPRVGPGNRAAVNLAGVELEELARGDVLVRPGTLRPTSIVDVELQLLEGEKPLRDQARVRVHLASAERLARVRLLEGASLAPGGSGLAQLRLERPGVAGRGDRLVLRSYSPAVTIGGARVLDPLPSKRRRGGAASLAQLEGLRAGGPRAAALTMIAAAGVKGLDAPTLAARLTLPQADLEALLAGAPGCAALAGEPRAWLCEAALERLAAGLEATLERFHREQPLRPAMALEELRRRVFAGAPAGAFDHVVARLEAARVVRPTADGLALGRHAVTLSPEEEAARTALLEAAADAGLSGVETGPLAARSGRDARLLERVARVLVGEGRLRRVGDGLLIEAARLDALKVEVRRRWPAGSRLDVAAFKELTGLSRKYVIPLLEYLDRERVTRRAGNERFVLAEGPGGR